MYVYMYIRTYVYMYSCMYICTCTYVHMHICIDLVDAVLDEGGVDLIAEKHLAQRRPSSEAVTYKAYI